MYDLNVGRGEAGNTDLELTSISVNMKTTNKIPQRYHVSREKCYLWTKHWRTQHMSNCGERKA